MSTETSPAMANLELELRSLHPSLMTPVAEAANGIVTNLLFERLPSGFDDRLLSILNDHGRGDLVAHIQRLRSLEREYRRAILTYSATFCPTEVRDLSKVSAENPPSDVHSMVRNEIYAGSIELISPARAADKIPDYKGPFPTTALYTLCSRDDAASRDKCDMYIYGLMYGVRVSQSMNGKLEICLPEMSTEAARLRILQFVSGMTGGRTETNGDGGDWMAFMGLLAGHSGASCK